LKSDDPVYNDIRATNATLHILDLEGLVCWHEITEFHGAGKRTHPYVWGLTDKAVTLYGGRSFEERRDVEHEYGLSQFHIDLETVCELNGWQLYWLQFDLKKTTDPDAYFCITTHEGKFHFFVEKERQKPSHHKQFKKWSVWYKYFNSEQCKKEWGFDKFRVIVIENTTERRDHLLHTLATVPIHEPFCKWFPPRNSKCTCKPRLINHRMFWVMTEDDDLNEPIFHTSKSDTYSLKEAVK